VKVKRDPLGQRAAKQVENQERKDMSNSTEQSTESKTSRVQIGNLPQQEKELKDQEAEKVKGGGGASGGVIQRCAGEEIPQTTRK